MKKLALILSVLGGLSISTVHAAIVTHTSDFIADGSRTQFTGFESIPNDGTFFTGGSGPYTDGGIKVQQINGNSGNDIWVTHLPVGTSGNHAWYPNGGDSGYTKITLADGSNFDNVGFGIGTGGSASLVIFELYDDNNLIAAGTSSMGAHYLGFSGGGFDTILVRDNYSNSDAVVTNGADQALTVDDIEASSRGTVPEPASLALLGLGLLSMVASRKRPRI